MGVNRYPAILAAKITMLDQERIFWHVEGLAFDWVYPWGRHIQARRLSITGDCGVLIAASTAPVRIIKRNALGKFDFNAAPVVFRERGLDDLAVLRFVEFQGEVCHCLFLSASFSGSGRGRLGVLPATLVPVC